MKKKPGLSKDNYDDMDFLAGTWTAKDYAEFIYFLDDQRKIIAEDAQKTLAAFQAGKYKPQSAPEVIMELRKSLDEKDE